MSWLRAVSPWVLAAFLVVAGLNHFWHPDPYDALIPSWLGSPRPWTLGSGVAEIACGLLVGAPRTRRLGGLAAVGLFVIVFPGNITSAVHADTAGERLVTYLRLPLQVPLVLWALQVHRDASRERLAALLRAGRALGRGAAPRPGAGRGRRERAAEAGRDRPRTGS